jgi:PAS domain S-box-containing protein
MKMKPAVPPGVAVFRRNLRPLLRYALIFAAYLCAFILLDFITQQFEQLPGVVAWYPPAGLTYALLLVFGVSFAPAVTIALFISSVFIYRMPQPPYLLFLWAFIISLIYTVAAAFLRRRIRFDWRLRKMRDVTWLVVATVLVSALLAVLSVSSSALSSDMPRSEVLRAVFEWWIGETVGVLTVTPFLLIHVMPWLKRFAEGQPVGLPVRRSMPRPTLSAIGQVASLALVLYWVFGARVLDEYQPMYLIALPLIWIALQRGLKGVGAGILALNSGVVLALWLFRFDLDRLGELELLMIINCIVGLLMGAAVTERRRAENELRSAKTFLDNIINAIADPVFVKDDKRQFVLVNDALCATVGRPRESLLGEDGDDMFPKEQVAVFRKVDAGVFDTGRENVNEEFLSNLASGEVRTIVTRKTRYIDPTGKRFLVGVIRDITGRKRAEEALRESEEKFRNYMESAPDGIFIVDDTGRYIETNEAACRMLGFTKAEIENLLIRDLLADESLEDGLAHFRRIMETGAAKSDLWHKHRDGAKRCLVVNAVRLSPTRILGFCKDITERKQRERELEAIAAVSTALRVTQTRAQMLPVILDQLLSLLAVDGAALVMLDPAGGEWRVELGRGAWSPFTGVHIPPGAGLNGQVVSGGRPYLNNDIQNAPSPFPHEGPNTCPCVAAAPLAVQGQIIGILWIGRARPLADSDLPLLIAIGEMAANAIHRATMHEKMERQVQRLAALHAIDAAISSSMDLPLTLNILLGHVTSQLEVDAAAVLLLNPQRQTLEFSAGHGFHSTAIERSLVRLGEGHAGEAALERRIVEVPSLAEGQPGFTRAALLAGEGFAAYYCAPLLAKGQVKGVLEIFHRAPVNPDPDWLAFLETLAGQAAIAIDGAELFDGLQRSNIELSIAYDATIEGWSRALDLRDRETEGHTLRVSELALRLARAAGVGEKDLISIYRGALLHDIGKMGVPDGILLKPGPLSDDEWVVMRRHPQLAYDMLAPIQYLKSALDIPYCHHEKWDGTGYPRGLKGDVIPLAARLFAVVDVWDALRSDRPYRAGWAEEKVIEHIQAGSGTHFDPHAVELFLRVRSENTEEPG